jgi:predicted acyl esterase
MFGTSYGGFNAIQVAMHNPPALKAIVPHAATDDRYNDDIHYNGGCMMGLDQLPYPLRMISMNALPPTPTLAGEEWASIWQTHLDNPPWMIEWLRHQTNDAYWQHGSLRADYGAMKCPVFHIGGWNDAYTNAVFRMLEKLEVPNKALVGPWTHSRPNVCFIGPRVDHFYEMLRWWDHWLKDVDTGIMGEPPITVYVQHSHAPERFPEAIPGEWRYEEAWPPKRQQHLMLHLSAGRALTPPGPLSPVRGREGEVIELGASPQTPARALPSAHPAGAAPLATLGEGTDELVYDPTVGTGGGFWCPADPPSGIAGDQRGDDARSLTYETAPLEHDLEILGTPEVILFGSSTAPVAFFCVKLCDVAPDGTSTLITRGALNATRRSSQQKPEPLEPKEVYELKIELRVMSWVVPAGHRLRLSIAGADWPLLWPSPYPATHSVRFGAAHPSRLVLPVVGTADKKLPAPQLRPPDPRQPMARVQVGKSYWETVHDAITRATTVRHGRQSTTTILDDQQLVLGSQSDVEATVAPDRPDRATVKGTVHWTIDRAGVVTEVSSHACIQSSVDALHVDVTLDVVRDGAPFFHRQWLESIPRNLL